MIKIIIPETTPPSWNKFYSGQHWSVRKEFADIWHELVAIYTKEQKTPKIKYNGRGIHIEVACYFANRRRQLDYDNICDKLIVDGLRRAGIIEDDDAKHVRSGSTSTHVDKDNPRTEIIISSV